ncbi:choice-of-anchor J domain-containing protein [Paenibacillus sedimenti]|uniref:Immune inhibitor A n=1 Tax=Paenibacillus sedimenti TaxID=2770274 RepID=A0A926QHS4_9BACL|nr:choice-of-anchor J domain-containing protein [Paenibacillus sedimenti]MBD0378834.1 immune inhibitor A [Paenibacillus sedimenti]
MRSRKALTLATSIFLAGTILTPSSALAQSKSFNPNPSVQDVGSKLRSESLADVKAAGRLDLSGDAAASGESGATSRITLAASDVGIVKKWLTNNDYTGKYALTDFTLRAVGTYGEVWVANNLQYPSGDPRNSMVSITDEQIQYMLNEFDNRMYQKEVEFFGPPQERKGEAGYNGWYKDESGRTVILIDNIKDQSYYNSNYPSYIAGYFSPTISDFADRNIMTVDAYDWLNRTGPNATKPYLYEGTFAHEFQHLLHRDSDSGEENFINEGLSDFAQYLVGYGHSQGHVDFFMNHLRNSLTLWGDQTDLQILGDYGNAYLFQLYLYEKYGEAFIQEEFTSQKHGIDSINAALAKVGAGKTFDQVYADYMTAVLLDGTYKGDSKTYNFDAIDLHANVESSVLADNTAPAWGTDFKTIVPDNKIDHLYFKGLDFLGTNWTTAQDSERGTVLWGNTGDQADNFLIKELDLTNLTQASLSFDTSYNIEEQWDFGSVQVSTDSGKTWTSLANSDTRSDIVDNGYPKIKENLPGFTGNSNGWKTETFDLSQYSGQKVLLGFRYMTDWGTTESGWYISNLKLNGSTIDPMTSTSGFLSLEQAIQEYINYQVQFIGYKKGQANGKDNHLNVIRFPDLLNMSEQDRIDLREMLHSSQYDRILMMTTYAAPEGKNGSVSYDYKVEMKSNKTKVK